MLGHLTPHVVREVQLHERARYVALAEAGKPRLLLHAAVRALPFLLDDVRGRLHRELALARFDFLDRYLHITVVMGQWSAPPGRDSRGGSRR